jgi:hypothetical protein
MELLKSSKDRPMIVAPDSAAAVHVATAEEGHVAVDTVEIVEVIAERAVVKSVLVEVAII